MCPSLAKYQILFTRPEFYDFYVALCCWVVRPYLNRNLNNKIADIVLVVCVGVGMYLCACLGPSRSLSQLSWSLYVCRCMFSMSLSSSLASPLRSLTLGVLLGTSLAAFSPFLAIVCTVVWSLCCRLVFFLSCCCWVLRCRCWSLFVLVLFPALRAQFCRWLGARALGLGCCCCCHLLSSWFVSSLPVACCRCRCFSCC